MKRMAHDHRVATLAVCGLLLAAPAFADDCELTAPREEALDAAGVEVVEIEARAGYLRVTGEEGAGEVRASGEACASSAELLEEIRLTARRSGDRVRIVVEMPEDWRGSWTARLDLEVEVPAGVALDVEDGSGSLDVRGVESASITDGSGEIRVESVAGDLRIKDGSGEITASDVAGEVRITDGSGEIELRRVGSVDIEADGSGGIDIAEVYGDVRVGNDGSGSISVRDVGGDFTVRRDGSGGIRYDRVAGLVSVPDDD